jgi:hypothetical protein
VWLERDWLISRALRAGAQRPLFAHFFESCREDVAEHTVHRGLTCVASIVETSSLLSRPDDMSRGGDVDIDFLGYREQ